MEIKKFRLLNVGHFRDLEVLLGPTQQNPSNVTVFVGNNGAGKTSLLKSLATSLSWFVSRLRREKGSGSPLPEEVILNSASSAAVEIELFDSLKQDSTAEASDCLFHWTIAKARRGRKGEHTSQLSGLNTIVEHYRRSLEQDENMNLPLIAFYPVERVVLDIPLKIRDRHTFLQLDGYDNSLNQGVDFRRFFEWFREREDSENESGLSPEVLEKLQTIVGPEHELWEELVKLKASAKDRQLTAVRTAITSFMPEFSNLRVRRKPRLHMSIDKNGETLNVSQLSQGEKSLMALVGDIARRLAMMNPSLENPLRGDGIVLIDEVDMHLHPTWQRMLIARLTNTFPECQFVLTTHSPLVISDCKDVLVYSLNNGELEELPSQYGQDANTVLLDVMDTSIRNAEVGRRLNDLLDAIQDSKISLAHTLIDKLEAELPETNLELSKAKLLLRRQELRHEKN